MGADKDLAGLKNLAKFDALNVKTRHARDQLRQDASCSDCDHCPKCKTHCPGGSNCHYCKHCYGWWTACCRLCGVYCRVEIGTYMPAEANEQITKRSAYSRH